MAIDRKYGKVTLEHGSIGDDEPVIVFRAKDKLLPEVLAYYYHLCGQAGSPRRHLRILSETMTAIVGWQDENDTKTPDSEASREWMK